MKSFFFIVSSKTIVALMSKIVQSGMLHRKKEEIKKKISSVTLFIKSFDMFPYWAKKKK